MAKAFRIEAYRVDPDVNEIRGPAGLIRLNPKAMGVLVLLADRAGQVVAKDELLDRVWEGVHVGDEVLTNAVYELRKAFADDARHARFIQTVYRSGYKLLPPARPETASEAARPSPRRAGWRWISMAGSALAVTAAASWFLVLEPWRCRRSIKVQVVDRARTEQSASVREFLRRRLAETGVFDVIDQGRPAAHTVFEILPIPDRGGLQVELKRNKNLRRIDEIGPGESSSGAEKLSITVRELAADDRCLRGRDKAAYLASGAMSVSVWGMVREAEKRRGARQLTEAAQQLDEALREDRNDVYALERYAHLNQTRGLVRDAKDRAKKARDSARERGIAGLVPILLERRLYELNGDPTRSKRLLERCSTTGSEDEMAYCKRLLAWHLNTYDRACEAALGMYQAIEEAPERFRHDPALYLYRAEFALSCGDLDTTRTSIETFERISSRRYREDTDNMWVWLGVLTGDYAGAQERLGLGEFRGDFRFRARHFQADLHRRHLACKAARKTYLEFLTSSRASERRNALGGLLELGYECRHEIAEATEAELDWARTRQQGSLWAPRAWAFYVLQAPDRNRLQTMRAKADAAGFVDPVACAPGEERPNRLDEEWFCLAAAAVATAEGRHREALRIHRHIEGRLKPDDKALFRFHYGRAIEQAEPRPGVRESIGQYCAALAWNPCHVQALAALGALSEASGRHGEARAAYDLAGEVVAKSDREVPLVKQIRDAARRLGAHPPAKLLCGRPVTETGSCRTR